MLFLASSTLGTLLLFRSFMLVGETAVLNLGDIIFLVAMFSEDIIFDERPLDYP